MVGQRLTIPGDFAVLSQKQGSVCKFPSGRLPPPMGLCNNSVMFSFSDPVSIGIK